MNILSKCLLLCSFGLALGICPTKGRAEGMTVGMHLASIHSKDNDRMNNDNLGAYVQSGHLVAGCYKNSIHRNSFYAGYVLEAGPFAITGGIISGYMRHNGQGHTRGALGPLLAFSARSPEFWGVRVRANYVPARLVKAADVLNLAIETHFN